MAAPKKLKMFRCYREPNIPPKPRNAFTMGDGADQLPGEAFATAIGVHIKAQYPKNKGGPREFLVPYANVEMMEFFAGETDV